MNRNRQDLGYQCNVPKGIVCRPDVAHNVFTCAATSKVDHDSSSSTSVNAFHGTTTSPIQYLAEHTNVSISGHLNLVTNISPEHACQPVPISEAEMK